MQRGRRIHRSRVGCSPHLPPPTTQLPVCIPPPPPPPGSSTGAGCQQEHMWGATTTHTHTHTHTCVSTREADTAVLYCSSAPCALSLTPHASHLTPYTTLLTPHTTCCAKQQLVSQQLFATKCTALTPAKELRVHSSNWTPQDALHTAPLTSG